MKLRKKIISTISLLVLVNSTANADKFVMKDGTIINGSIISETSTSYLLRAEVTRNVYAEKTVLKSKVSEIKKTDPSIAAYQKLTSILPTQDLMEVAEYETIIKSDLEAFLEDHPSSPHAKDVETILDTLKKEYHTIKSGGIKLGGKLLTAEQIEADKYNVEAAKEYHKFMGYAGKKQYRPALSTLERLEDTYPDAEYTRRAQKTALTILPLYEEKLQKLYDGIDALKMKRERALNAMTSGEKSRTKKIFEQEELRYQQLLDLATDSKKKTKWLPINSYFEEPIERNLRMIPSEIKRITTAAEKPTIDAGKLYRDTFAALADGDYTVAKEHFDKFTRTRPPEELVNELGPRLEAAKLAMEAEAAQKKEEEALAKKKAAEEKRKAEQAERDAKKKGKGKSLKDKTIDNINKKKNLQERLGQ